ncbi:MAG: hypothetical protein MHM6MM_004403 [Cercozoa sp. M6MM]
MKALTEVIEEIALQVRKGPINTAFSGTTLCCGITAGEHLYVANVGDSRAILGYNLRLENHKPIVQTLELTEDHKPTNPGEYDRIIASNGRVATLPGPPNTDCGPMRVWMKQLDVPGLAMSRSIGDDIAASVGVIATPDVRCFNLRDLGANFAVFATDGVFEFLSSEYVSGLIAKRVNHIEKAASKLVKDAVSSWRRSEDVVDDITAVIAVLKVPDEVVDALSEREGQLQALHNQHGSRAPRRPDGHSSLSNGPSG